MFTPQSPTLPNSLEQKLGIVMSVDQERGILTLLHRDGACSHFNAAPSLLGDLRIGVPVVVLVENRIVRSLRRL